MKGANKSRGAMIFLWFTFGNAEYLSQIVLKQSKKGKVLWKQDIDQQRRTTTAPIQCSYIKSFSLGDFPGKREPESKYKKRCF